MAINKVIVNNETLIDLTDDTVTENDVANGKTFHLASGIKATGNATIGDYAGSPENGGNANCTNAILYGAISSTSTTSALNAEIENFPESYSDGIIVMLKNEEITSSTHFTLSINDLPALPVVPSLSLTTVQDPIFKINTAMLFILDTSILETPIDYNYAGWICYQGEDSAVQEITMTDTEVDSAVNAAWSNGGS